MKTAKQQKEHAPPHILMVQPKGSVNSEISLGAPRSFMLTLIVVGSVAAEDVVESVTNDILPHALRNLEGLTPV